MRTITHLFKTYFPYTQGGLEEAIRQIGKYSSKNGFNVKVVSVANENREMTLEGIQCRYYAQSFGNSSMPVSLGLIKDFKRIINETDILHLHFPWPPGELLTILSSVRKPIVITFHCDILKYKIMRKIYTPCIKALFNKANFIVPTSDNLLNSTKILHNYRDKCYPINLWLDSTRFKNLGDPPIKFKKEVEILKKYALFVGVLRWYKGLEILLDSAKYVENNIVIVGKGPLMTKLKSRIENENIKNVHLLVISQI